MSDFRFELDSDGVRELLNSQEMVNVLEQHAQQMSVDGNISVHYGSVRPNVSCKVEE